MENIYLTFSLANDMRNITKMAEVFFFNTVTKYIIMKNFHHTLISHVINAKIIPPYQRFHRTSGDKEIFLSWCPFVPGQGQEQELQNVPEQISISRDLPGQNHLPKKNKRQEKDVLQQESIVLGRDGKACKNPVLYTLTILVARIASWYTWRAARCTPNEWRAAKRCGLVRHRRESRKSLLV